MSCERMPSKRSGSLKTCEKPSNTLILDDNEEIAPVRENSLSLKKRKKKLESPIDERLGLEIANHKLNPEVDSKMDAFKLMMKSRNKVIGSNSSGKEVTEKPESLGEKMAKADAKASIKLRLQSMADKKRSLKKKITDEERDEHIKNALDKRAKRLKKMLMNKSSVESNVEIQDSEDEFLKKPLIDQKIVCDNEPKVKKCEMSKLIFVLDVPNKSTVKIEAVVKSEDSTPKEDIAFLNCLSPSIKRKQSVLSYFNKIEKHPINVDDNKTIILKAEIDRGQKKSTPKLSLHRPKKVSLSEIDNIVPEPVIVVLENESDHTNNSFSEMTGRPKRNIRRPLKYISNSEEDSPVEEYCNDTKRKKRTKNSSVKVVSEMSIVARKKDFKESSVTPLQTIDLNSSIKNKGKECQISLSDNNKKSAGTRLAPLFILKPFIDPAVLAARKEFLHSSSPEQIKRTVEKPKSQMEFTHESFLEVCHVQQIPSTESVEYTSWNLPIISPNKLEEVLCLKPNFNAVKTFYLGQFTQCKEDKKDGLDSLKSCTEPVNLSQSLREMKCKYPEFPFYKVFRVLRDQLGSFPLEPELQNSQICFENSESNDFEVYEKLNMNVSNRRVALWIEKYKPISTSDVLGNCRCVKFIKEWLQNWKEYSEEMIYKTDVTTRTKKTSTSSDEFCLSDSESWDSTKQPNNTLIISGPQGCGKTSFIYAVANELNINVLEINASSKRTGKRILTEMQEATKSHKVIRSQMCNLDAPSQHFSSGSNSSHRDEDVSLNSQGHGNVQRMSMILVEDADVVFEQDDGFVAALAQIVQSSKRPVLLVTSDLTCAHMQRFITRSNIVKFSPPNPKVMGAWLEVICLLESGQASKQICQYLLELNGGDVRRTMHQLQFLIQGSCSASYNGENDMQICDKSQKEEVIISDDISNSSWLDQVTDDPNIKNNVQNQHLTSILRSFLDIQVLIFNQHTFKIPYSINIQNIWWNVFPMLSEISCRTDDKKNQSSMNDLSIFLRNLSDIECMSRYTECKESKDHLTKFWETSVIDSISEEENHTACRWYQDVSSSWSHFMLASNFHALATKSGLSDFELDISLPRLDKKRQFEEVLNTHRAVSEIVPPYSHLQRSALALDYLPTLRTICRSEKDRQGCNLKRKNRFSHYLKSMGTDCKEKDYNILCNTLNNP